MLIFWCVKLKKRLSSHLAHLPSRKGLPMSKQKMRLSSADLDIQQSVFVGCPTFRAPCVVLSRSSTEFASSIQERAPYKLVKLYNPQLNIIYIYRYDISYYIYIYIYISTINIHKSLLLYGAHTHIVGDAPIGLVRRRCVDFGFEGGADGGRLNHE